MNIVPQPEMGEVIIDGLGRREVPIGTLVLDDAGDILAVGPKGYHQETCYNVNTLMEAEPDWGVEDVGVVNVYVKAQVSKLDVPLPNNAGAAIALAYQNGRKPDAIAVRTLANGWRALSFDRGDAYGVSVEELKEALREGRATILSEGNKPSE